MRTVRTVSVTSGVVLGLVGLLWALGGSAPARAGVPVTYPAGEHGIRAQIATTLSYTINLPIVMRDFELRLDPNDPMYLAGQQWALEKVRAPQAWYLSTGHAVTVAVVDTGVMLDHPDLANSLWVNAGEIADNGLDDDNNGCVDDIHGCDFIDGDGVPDDGHGHGTHVAGIVGATTDNGIGIAGMGWGVTVMPVRVLNSSGNGSVLQVAEGIRYAADNGAQVINLSLAGYDSECVQTLEDAVSYAQSKGALVIAAAGNYSINLSFYPAACAGVVGVAATDSADQKASFSNYGSYVDVAAPGVGILSTKMAPLDYGLNSGTSMATPMVSGLAALIWARFPSVTSSQVSSAIFTSAEDLGELGWDPYFGWGRIDAANALYTITSAGGTAPPAGAVLAADRSSAVDGAPTFPPAPFQPGEVIVALREGALLQGLGDWHVLHASTRAGVYLIRVPVGSEWAAIRSLQVRADVLYTHPNYILTVAAD